MKRKRRTEKINIDPIVVDDKNDVLPEPPKKRRKKDRISLVDHILKILDVNSDGLTKKKIQVLCDDILIKRNCRFPNQTVSSTLSVLKKQNKISQMGDRRPHVYILKSNELDFNKVQSHNIKPVKNKRPYPALRVFIQRCLQNGPKNKSEIMDFLQHEIDEGRYPHITKFAQTVSANLTSMFKKGQLKKNGKWRYYIYELTIDETGKGTGLIVKPKPRKRNVSKIKKKKLKKTIDTK